MEAKNIIVKMSERTIFHSWVIDNPIHTYRDFFVPRVGEYVFIPEYNDLKVVSVIWALAEHYDTVVLMVENPKILNFSLARKNKFK